MPKTITLRGSYGYTSYQLRNSDADVVNASQASWIVANTGSKKNLYPFQVVDNDPNVRIIGGTINGTVSQTMDWRDAYINSAAVRVEDTTQATIEDWRISKAWDAIRISGTSKGFTIEDAWLSGIRDDAVENDQKNGGTIRDSLFDGVFAGISTDGSGSGAGSTITLDGVLMRMETYNYKGKMTHQSPFKADVGGGNPSYRITDSIIAIEQVRHDGTNRMEVAFDKMTQVTNSYYLNLSDTKLPSSYPDIPKGFTVLQGKAARDFWAKSKADWIDDHKGGSAARDIAGLLSSTASAEIIRGTHDSETLRGTDADDVIKGRDGQDVLFGADGEDVLTGGFGRDSFVFNAPPDAGSVDTITDFKPGVDRILLDDSVFKALGTGSAGDPKMLASRYFDGDGKADSGNGQVILDRATGALLYDADGSGRGEAVEFARVDPGLVLHHDDFLLV
jgi:Ca2+-binding RTX toxin-like protein